MNWQRVRKVAAAGVALGAISCAFEHRPPSALPGVPTSWTTDTCAAAVTDRDRDGIHDLCELELARAFAPLLVVDRQDCSWDGRRLAGGYFYAVLPGPGATGVRIAYLPAYFRDCGWTGPPCAMKGHDCSAHPGDSELIVVDVRPHELPGRWRAESLFLSAHCLGRSAGRCRWYGASQLAHFSWAEQIGGAPRVWVARGKHANYPSQSDCDSGHWYYDSCDGNDVAYRFPIHSDEQGIGSRTHPLPDVGSRSGCVTGGQLPLGNEHADSGAVECLWDDARTFRGWQRTASRGATAYGRVLAMTGF